jgi:CRP-like cAMP-binding protein
MEAQPNLFLRALSNSDYLLLKPYLRSVTLERHSILSFSDTKIGCAYFPHDSVLSLIVFLSDGESIAVGIVGRDGVVGASAALGAPYGFYDVVVQAPGSATTIDIRRLTPLLDKSRTLRDSLFRFCHLKRIIAQQNAVCLAKHQINARICRWLRRMADLTDRDEFPMTQEFLARLLGVQRVSVALAAERLQRVGYIKYRHGRVRIIQRDALEASACECYQTVNDKMAKLFEGTPFVSELTQGRISVERSEMLTARPKAFN